MELYPEKFSIRKAIEDACALSQPIALKKAVQIDVNVAPKLGEVTIDQQKFKQILYNLLSNAIKFNHDSATDLLQIGAMSMLLATYATVLAIGPSLTGG